MATSSTGPDSSLKLSSVDAVQMKFVTFQNKRKKTSSVILEPKVKRVQEEYQLIRADLWGRFHDSLIAQILVKLPFFSLLRFCSTCKTWRQKSLIDHPLPMFYHAGKLVIHNPHRGAWELVPMPFLPVDRFGPVTLIASASGLLCFGTKCMDNFVICNPLTEKCKIIEMPWRHRVQCYSEAHIPDVFRSDYEPNKETRAKVQSLAFGLVVNLDTRSFKLIVASSALCGGKIIAYNSLSNYWEKIDGGSYPEGIPTWIPLHVVPFSGYMYRTTCNWTCDLRIKVFKYDFQQKTWMSMPVPEELKLPSMLVQHYNTMLCLTQNPNDEEGLVIFEIQDSALKRWPIAQSRPVIKLFEAMGLSIRAKPQGQGLIRVGFYDMPPDSLCLGLGEHMFCIATKRSDGCSGSTFSLRVGVHNFSTNSTVLSNYEECDWLSGCSSTEIRALWHVFRPSFASWD